MTQQEALNILKSGANVFLTGEPGSGKTYTINRYVEYLIDNGILPAITASTGIAATHIGGMTIHSWSGIGVNRILREEDFAMLLKRKRLISRLTRARVLIIDEISMLDAQALDLIERVCRNLKRRNAPWGGLQVVFVGDFFQLPPISPRGEEPRKFAYHALSWQKANLSICYLSEQHRQGDEKFIFLLNSIRQGNISDKINTLLASRKVNLQASIENSTRLYSHNIDVDRINNGKLNALKDKEKKFVMEVRGPDDLVQQLKRGCLSPEILHLKVGAKVMFTKNNFEQGFVNGTIGMVEKFSKNGMPVVHTEGGRVVEVDQAEWSVADGETTLARIFQLPLRLAWAITVHKSQGMTLDSAIVDLSEAFEYGQGYVALSRVRTLEGLHVVGYNERSLQVHPEVINIDIHFREESSLSREKLAKISISEKETAENEFIRACGGKKNKFLHSDKKIKKDFVFTAAKKESTYDITLALWRQRCNLIDISRARGLATSTIFSHLEELYMRGKIEAAEFKKIATPRLLESLPKINLTFKEFGFVKLSPVFEKLNGEYSYDDLRLARIILSGRQN